MPSASVCGLALQWIEMKRSAFIELATNVLSSSPKKISLFLVSITVQSGRASSIFALALIVYRVSNLSL